MSLKVRNRLAAGVTVIANEFIDRYMAAASGEYVKVYLYLLRHSGEPVTVESAAEALHHTEADVRRAFSYWKQAGVLEEEPEAAVSACPEHLACVREAGDEAGRKETLAAEPASACDLTALRQDENFKQLLFITEQYLNKAGKMTATDCQILANLYQKLQMPFELLEYLMEYCAQNQHYSLRYAEKVALNWHERGFRTVEEARAYSRGFSKESFAVMKAMGLTGRNPADSEYALMEKWFRQYGFTREIVVEACGRTIRSIQTPSFAYADRILSDWKEAGVRTFSDIAALDKKRNKKAETGAENGEKKPEDAGGYPKRVSGRQSSRRTNRFHNLEEHGYDYDEMVWNMINPMQKTGGSNGAQ